MSFLSAHPIEAAHVLEQEHPERLASFIAELEPEVAAKVLMPMMPDVAAECLKALNSDTCVAIISHLPIHSSSSLMRRIDRDKRDELLGELPQLVASRLRHILSYASDSAGAWAEPDALAVSGDATVGAVLTRARRAPESLNKYIYVLNDQQQLVGTVDSRRCFLAPRATKIHVLAEHHPVSVRARSSLSEVAGLPGWQRFTVLPVIDRSNTFVGVLRRRRLTQALESTNAKPAPTGLTDTAAELAELYWNTAVSVFYGDRNEEP